MLSNTVEADVPKSLHYVSPSVVLIAKNIYMIMIIGSSMLTSPTTPPVDYTPELTMLSLRNHDCLPGN